ncbi:MAG: glycosyltransferase [Chitinophagales bacterium]|nr:glycosyltransferase [Chitinophagales bacterium]
MNQPKISIITIVFNKADEIEYTLKSVTEQTYSHIEYIVIDGHSTDGTIEIIQKYLNQINIYISEKDQGIYDAMNKGLSKASGDYVLFINGGDSLHQKETIQDIVDKSFSNLQAADIIFGECMLIRPDRTYISTRSANKHQQFPTSLPHLSFKHGTNVSHQSFMTKRKLAPFFDLQYKWSSDVDWMLNCMKKAHLTLAYDGIISDFVIGGVTDRHRLSSLWERLKIMKKHYGFFNTILFHFEIILIRLKEKLVLSS